MKRFVWVLMLLLLVSLVSAVDYPEPLGYVSDYAEVISPEYESQIESLLTQLEKNTTVEVAVLTVDDFGDSEINNYAVGLFREWGIGKEDINNGLLILVKPKTAEEDGEWRIEVGYGLEGLITDAMAGRIGRDTMLPYFKENNYGQGIYAAVVDVKGLVEGEGEVISKYSGDDFEAKNDFDYFYVAFFIALIVGGIVATTTKKVKNKKIKWGIKIGAGVLIAIGLIVLWSYIIALIFFVIYLFVGGRGGGFMFFPGFGGRGRGSGGFGGFGGGLSGGGGAGGNW
ncbi:TPM domain-containing protein [Nanoarchaeota archaeon]